MSNSGTNKRHFERARRVVPGGMQVTFHNSEAIVPHYIVRAEGSHLWDMDGNEYIDYLLGGGPNILGHGNPAMREALKRQIDCLYGRETTALEAYAAEKLSRYVPCADWVRFACSGAEAMAYAWRIARAHTDRNMIVRFAGHYHGNLDFEYGGVADDAAYPVPRESRRDEGSLVSRMLCTAGRAQHAYHDTFLIEWNDLEGLRALLEKHAGEIAAICMEPINISSYGCCPLPGYLQGVRELCDEFSVLLIFDEIVTGFRMGLGGAQAHFAVIPDIAVFGKALGGGIPVSAFCGRRAIMNTLTDGKAITVGTYNGHPLSMTAVITTIEELERDDAVAFKNINRLGTRLASELTDIFKRHGLSMMLQGFPGAWKLSWSSEGVIRNQADGLRQGDCMARAFAFGAFLEQKRIIAWGGFMIGAAHTDTDIDETLARADGACEEYARETN